MITHPALRHFLLLSATALFQLPMLSAQTAKQPISLDAYFGETSYGAARLAPDGSAAVIATHSPDWKNNRYRSDLWVWRTAANKLEQLTSSGHDDGPAWSPDGRYIAFSSDRMIPEDAGAESGKEADKDGAKSRVWLISVAGGEAVPLYRGKYDLHAFAWAPDGSAVYLSITEPLSKDEQETQEKNWKDVVRWRESERGDVLLRLPVAEAEAGLARAPLPHQETASPKPNVAALPDGAAVVAHSKLTIDSIVPAPDRNTVAFVTTAVSHRLERPEDVEIYAAPSSGGEAKQLTNNQGLESDLHWSPDSKRLFFAVRAAGGSVEGKYQDVQGRLYALDAAGGTPQRLGADFDGSWDSYTLLPDGGLLATGLKGTEQQVYRLELAHPSHIVRLDGLPGTYGGLDAEHPVASHAANAHPAGASAGRLLFVHSAIDEPTEIYLADSPEHLKNAKTLTDFNQFFRNYAQPEWKPYTWKADDGAAVEGVLLYPPGMREAKHLPMLTLIHGGPADADGNRFGANWYDWAGLAAANGWLVFRPNYRGSSGYGDAFMGAIKPHLVSRPGKDILEGVDELVKDGSADPDHLAIAGYSYGGYMTNWLITQTTRFKAAATGAGAVEHAANWGNDDLTFDDAWYLAGRPWENADLYASEAALFQMNKVTTPTHILGGDADVRVSFLEDVLLERALQALNVPHALLVFPGEGHPLGKNPWHGYIALREELAWVNKYAGTPAKPETGK